MLLKAGCLSEPDKGSHTKWKHPLINCRIILFRKDNLDARGDREKEVMQLIKDIEEAQS